MRRLEKQITQKDELEEILKTGKVIRVAFAGSEPYVLPFNYAYSAGKIYIHCAKEGKKLDIIKIDPRVAFEVTIDMALKEGEVSCGYSYAYRCVLGKGAARFSDEREELIQGLDAIMLQQAGITENIYRPETIRKVALIIIDVKELNGKKAAS
jgi:uncharacterized protein